MSHIDAGVENRKAQPHVHEWILSAEDDYSDYYVCLLCDAARIVEPSDRLTGAGEPW